jgi:hypothetical protein
MATLGRNCRLDGLESEHRRIQKSKIIKKKKTEREGRLVLNVINFQIVADSVGDYTAIPRLAQELTTG